VAGTNSVTKTMRVRVVAELPLAWRHHCGALNDGAWTHQAVCNGCRHETRSSEVTGQYVLAEYTP
jgi:hypothetical protein